MDIIEFFQLSAGRWFSQRSSHHFSDTPSAAGASELNIDLLDNAESEIVQLCQTYQVDPALVLCATRINWTETNTLSSRKASGSTVLVAIASSETPNQGQILHHNLANNLADNGSAPTPSRYIIGSDEALTFITTQETLQVEERIWFASPNLRLRSRILKQSDGFSSTSFCSEIRMISKPQ
jgi:hypothetical protein